MRLAEIKESWLISQLERLKGKGMSKTDISKALNISPQQLNNVTNGSRGITDQFIDKFVETFNLNQIDLLPKSPILKGAPYFDVDFCGGFDLVFNDQSAIPAGYIDLPQYEKVDSWANITGHSMEPLISNGDIIALRKIEDWHTYLLYGQIYGIVTPEYRTVKRIRKASNPDNVVLEPINKDFDPTEIPKKIITGLWLVVGCAKRFF